MSTPIPRRLILPLALAAVILLAAGILIKNSLSPFNTQPGQVTPRPAEILYLSPSRAPELWRVSPDGQARAQLTSTGGQVYDYNVSADGSRLIYSVKNGQQGIDLWEMDRQGRSPHLLLPCGTDWCINPAYSPDGKKVAYSRRKITGLPGRDPDPPQIWLLDLATQATDVLLPDPNMGGSGPSWSPDGRYLAFYDGLSGGVRVQDLQGRAGFLLPSEEGSGVEWLPDSLRLFYTQAETNGDPPYNAIYEADVKTHQSHVALIEDAAAEGDHSPAEYSVPALSPAGDWAAVGRRLAGSSSGKQLWLVRLGAGQNPAGRQPITSDETFNHAAYHWDPQGARLVFQRLALGSGDSLPQVAVWDRAGGKTLLLAEDAYQPRWMP